MFKNLLFNHGFSKAAAIHSNFAYINAGLEIPLYSPQRLVPFNLPLISQKRNSTSFFTRC